MSGQFKKGCLYVFVSVLMAGAGGLWGDAPTTISVTANNIVYLSGQNNTTTFTGRAMDTDGDLSHISFYINGPGYPSWNFVGSDYSPSGFDAYGSYVWTPPSAGTWSVHIRAYDSDGTVDSNGNILNTFVAQSGVAPVTVSISAENMFYQSGQNVETTITGRATDVNDDLHHIDFYINGAGYPGWNSVGNDYGISGGDAYGSYDWSPPAAGSWNVHLRAYDENSVVDSNGDISSSFKAHDPTTNYNEAEFVRYENLPYVLTPGQTYNDVKVVMKNTGSKTWTTDSSPHGLGSHNPQDNTTWGLNRDAITANVSTGAEHTFTFNITAPSTAGEYNFQWRMVEDAVEWFGEYTPEHTIVVEQDYQTVHSSYPVGHDYDADGWSNEAGGPHGHEHNHGQW